MCSSNTTRDLQRLSWLLYQKTSYSWFCIAWSKAHRESGRVSSSCWHPEATTNKTMLPIKLYLLTSYWSCQIVLSFQNWWGNLFILLFKSESLCTTQTFYLMPTIWICRILVFEIHCLPFLLRYLVSSRCSTSVSLWSAWILTHHLVIAHDSKFRHTSLFGGVLMEKLTAH